LYFIQMQTISMLSHAHVIDVARETECNSIATADGSNKLSPSNRIRADDWISDKYNKIDPRVLFKQILNDHLSFARETERVSLATADGSSNLLPSNQFRADDWNFNKYNKTDTRVLFKQIVNDHLSFARDTERVSLATADGSSNLLPSNRLRADDQASNIKERLHIVLHDNLSFARHTERVSLATADGSNKLPPSNRIRADDRASSIKERLHTVLHDNLSIARDTERLSLATATGATTCYHRINFGPTIGSYEDERHAPTCMHFRLRIVLLS